jgi:diguanylate cyclase (GGDEF)-like protein/PAS domain S-box-containing protein
MPNEAEHHKRILDSLYDGVYFVDRDRRITYWNGGAERISGYSAGQVLGRSCFDNLLSHVDDHGRPLCTTGCPLAATIEDGRSRETQVYLRHAGGHRVPVLVRAIPYRDRDGRIVGAVEVFRDNTAYTHALHRLSELNREAFQDPLTTIGNRRFIEARLRLCQTECAEQGVTSGVLFIDVDRFKAINDRYGHDAGDAVLRVIANTLRYSVRSTDHLGRWGGDEFVAVVRDIDRHQATSIADTLRALIEHSRVAVRDVEIGVTVSVGATLTRPDDTTEGLLMRADRLLYEGKAAGRNTVVVGE